MPLIGIGYRRIDMGEERPSYDELVDLLREQQRQLEELRAENARLRAQLDEANRKSKRQAAPFRKGPPKADPKRPGRKSGDDHGSHGHRPTPPPEAVDEVLEAPLPQSCPHCRGELLESEVATQFQAEIPKKPIIRQFNVHVGHCLKCQRRVQGRHELQASDALGAAASQVGPDAQAAVVSLNKEAGLSHGKIAAALGTLFGIDLTRGACAQIVLRAGERLTPAYEEILSATRDADRLTVDETGWRVGGTSAWLHVWVSERATCYAVDANRHAGALEGVIGLDWDGVLIHDGFSSYDRFTDAIHQQCTAHILRRARSMLERGSRGAVRFPRQVVDIFSGAAHLRNEYLKGRVPEPVWATARDRFENRLSDILRRPRGSPELERLRQHLWNHFGDWFAFLVDPSVDATNWRAEQAVRPAVVNRKVWGGNRTWAGARAQGVLASVLRTCHQQGIPSLDFVSRSLRAFNNPALPRPILLTSR